MRLKKLLLSSICYCSVGLGLLLSQSTTTKSVYLGTTWLNNLDGFQFEITDRHGNILKLNTFDDLSEVSLSVGFRVVNENNRFHTLSLIGLSYQSNTEAIIAPFGPDSLFSTAFGREKNSVNMSLLYEYGKRFMKSEEQKFIPSLGIGIAPYFNYQSIVPFTSNFFPLYATDWGLNLMITPQLELSIGKSITFFLRPSINFAKVSVHTQKTETPYYDDLIIERNMLLKTNFLVNQISLGTHYSFNLQRK